MNDPQREAQRMLFGHPTGLYTLFFAEMWERFSYYGMRALLVFYMIKGFLGYGDSRAYSVYGAYTALVYMTPFIGGMLADRLLGQRIAVVIGGSLMAGGHLLMTVENQWAFFFALALLIVGNGFFKPNISTTVGSLYQEGSPRRDDGFNIFYMGINLGAAMSPLLCGYVGETYGWHYGFGLATIGMLVGLAVFVMPNRVTQALIGVAALASGAGLVWFTPDNAWAVGINVFIALALVIAAVIACIALNRDGLPKWAGARPQSAPAGRDRLVYAGIALSIPVFALLVSGFSPITADGLPYQLIEADTVRTIQTGVEPETFAAIEQSSLNQQQKCELVQDIEAGHVGESSLQVLRGAGVSPTAVDDIADGGGGARQILGVLLTEASKPAGMVLTLLGLLAFGYLFRETFRLPKVPKERMLAALALIFFQMLFFAFFEQAGSSVNNFTDRNVDRVGERSQVTADMVATTIQLQPTQEQLGYPYQGQPFTLDTLDGMRKDADTPDFQIDWPLSEAHVGMGIANRNDELPASIFQSVNPTYILVFALLFNVLWSFLRKYDLDPSAAVKFALGLIQLGLGFGAYWLGAEAADDRGMVAIGWLFLGYLLQTTGELCLSPVGLSVMTKLAPTILVSTLMGGWFLATAFSQYLAAIISQFTGIEHGGESSCATAFPTPSESLSLYGDVFGQVAITAVICGAICLLISPLLTRWMHLGKSDSAS